MADDSNVLNKFESIVNHFGEVVAQMKSVAEGKFSDIEKKVDSQGGVGKSVWSAVGDWLPIAEKKAKDETIGPFAPSGTPDALRDQTTGKQRWSMLGSGLKDIGIGAFGAKKDKDGDVAAMSAADSGKQIMGGIGSIAGALGGPVGQVGMLFAKLGEKLIGAIDFMQQYSEALHKQNMQFAEFSASMATVQAQQEVRDIQLSQQRGERRAEAAGYLAEGKSELATQTAPWGDALSNLQSRIVGWADKKIAAILKPINYLAEWAGLIDVEDDEVAESPLDKYYQSEYQKAYGRPSRF